MAITSDSRCATLAAASFPSTAISVPIGSMSTSPHLENDQGLMSPPASHRSALPPRGPGPFGPSHASRPAFSRGSARPLGRPVVRPLVQKHILELGGNHDAAKHPLGQGPSALGGWRLKTYRGPETWKETSDEADGFGRYDPHGRIGERVRAVQGHRAEDAGVSGECGSGRGRGPRRSWPRLLARPDPEGGRRPRGRASCPRWRATSPRPLEGGGPDRLGAHDRAADHDRAGGDAR